MSPPCPLSVWNRARNNSGCIRCRNTPIQLSLRGRLVSNNCRELCRTVIVIHQISFHTYCSLTNQIDLVLSLPEVANAVPNAHLDISDAAETCSRPHITLLEWNEIGSVLVRCSHWGGDCYGRRLCLLEIGESTVVQQEWYLVLNSLVHRQAGCIEVRCVVKWKLEICAHLFTRLDESEGGLTRLTLSTETSIKRAWIVCALGSQILSMLLYHV